MPAATERSALCFVIGPIGKDSTAERKHADLLLHSVIKHVLETDEFKYKVKRADEDADPGMIGDRVISDIINADLVVADLTDLNPNAFYELGIRHSTGKPTIHIAKLGTVLPFDNFAHRTIFVDLMDWHSTEAGRTRLAESARAVKAPDYKVSNPITQANANFRMRQSDDPNERLIADMQERMAALESAFVKKQNDDFRNRDYEWLRPRSHTRDARLVGSVLVDDDGLPGTLVSFTSAAGLSNEDISQIRAALLEQFGHFTEISRSALVFRVTVPGAIEANRVTLPVELAGIQIETMRPST